MGHTCRHPLGVIVRPAADPDDHIIQPRSVQPDGTPGHIERHPATQVTRLASERPVVLSAAMRRPPGVARSTRRAVTGHPPDIGRDRRRVVRVRAHWQVAAGLAVPKAGGLPPQPAGLPGPSTEAAGRVSRPGLFIPSGGCRRAPVRGAMVLGEQVRGLDQEARFQEGQQTSDIQ
jgi:hypothetical protein